jgi:hypothetical protein
MMNTKNELQKVSVLRLALFVENQIIVWNRVNEAQISISTTPHSINSKTVSVTGSDKYFYLDDVHTDAGAK